MSDIDVGLLVDRDASKWATHAQFTHELSLALGGPDLDVVLLNDAPIELAYTIIARGCVLYERDITTRVEYEAAVMSRYGDYLPVLRAFREAILEEDEYQPEWNGIERRFDELSEHLTRLEALPGKRRAGSTRIYRSGGKREDCLPSRNNSLQAEPVL